MDVDEERTGDGQVQAPACNVVRSRGGLWYTRHAMWNRAKARGVDSLRDLPDGDYDACLKEVHEYVRMHPGSSSGLITPSISCDCFGTNLWRK